MNYVRITSYFLISILLFSLPLTMVGSKKKHRGTVNLHNLLQAQIPFIGDKTSQEAQAKKHTSSHSLAECSCLPYLLLNCVTPTTLCNTSDGSFTLDTPIVAPGSTPPYIVTILKKGVSVSTQPYSGSGTLTITNLPTGTYEIMITDSSTPTPCVCGVYGCVFINSQTSPLEIVAAKEGVSCPNGTDGMITIKNIKKGSGSYEVFFGFFGCNPTSFTSGQSPLVFSGLAAGLYLIPIRDTVTGCAGTLAVNIAPCNPNTPRKKENFTACTGSIFVCR